MDAKQYGFEIHEAMLALFDGTATPEQQKVCFREIIRLQGKLYATEKRSGMPEYDTDFYRVPRATGRN